MRIILPDGGEVPPEIDLVVKDGWSWDMHDTLRKPFLTVDDKPRYRP